MQKSIVQSLTQYNKLFKPQLSVVTADVTAKKLVDRNMQRVVLVLAGPGAGGLFVFPNPNIGPGQGIGLTTGYPVVVFNINDHPLLVQDEWWAISGLGGQDVAIAEYFYIGEG